MTITNVRTLMFTFFNPAVASKKLHDDLKDHRVRIKTLMYEYEKLSKWNHQYVSTLSLLTEAMQALIWKKDKKHKYILANPLHCQKFFGFQGSKECLDYIIGKTDTYLIQSLFREHKVQNTFGEICMLSDDYTKCQKGITHFLEAGVVDGDEILLYTIKTPQFADDSTFVGTIGMAWDMSSQSDFLVTQLKRWIYSKKATRLYHEKGVFCYAINPELKKCQIFHHICPTPERGKECDGDCNLREDRGFINEESKDKLE